MHSKTKPIQPWKNKSISYNFPEQRKVEIILNYIFWIFSREREKRPGQGRYKEQRCHFSVRLGIGGGIIQGSKYNPPPQKKKIELRLPKGVKHEKR